MAGFLRDKLAITLPISYSNSFAPIQMRSARFHRYQRANPNATGSASYVLSNDQVDEYPLSWCIDIEQCYKAMAYFFVNNGAMPSWVSWHES